MRPCRRRLPEFWKEIPQRRRVLCLQAMLEQPGKPGELEAVRQATNIPKRIWQKINIADRMSLLDRCDWANLTPTPTPVFEKYQYKGVEYIFPAENFTNGTCLEYPLADEYLSAYLKSGEGNELLKLTATLVREHDPDTNAAIKRDDFRVMLSSRAEVDARVERLQGIPEAVQYATLLYFIGVKTMVFNLYGHWMFEPPDEDGDEPSDGDPLGWWGMYLDAAKGDVTKLEAIHQSNFHNFCLMEVRRRKQVKDAEMRQRLSTN